MSGQKSSEGGPYNTGFLSSAMDFCLMLGKAAKPAVL